MTATKPAGRVTHEPQHRDTHEPQHPDATKPLRADARRNREAVLEAAAATFNAAGVDAPLEEVARRAGVGIGTLYRHFPSREALIEGVYRREVELLCDAAPVLLAEHDAVDALAEWMQRFVGYVATKRGLAGVLRARPDDTAELFAYVQGRMQDATVLLLDAAAGTGRIRSDIDPADLRRALGGICMVSDADGWQDQARRLVALVMDGLRYGAPVPS